MALATADRIVDVHIVDEHPIFEEHEWETENAFIVTAKESNRARWVFGFEAEHPHYLTIKDYVTAESVLTQLDIELEPAKSIQAELIACVASRPHESIKLFSKLGIVTFLFTILVYYIGGALIVNPVVAFFGILACLVFWIMTKGDEYLHHR